LPAHGVGTHPSPKKLLAMLTPHTGNAGI